MAYVFAAASLINYIKSFRKNNDEYFNKKNNLNLPNYEAIVPAKNEELNIRDCLVSLINQEHKPKRIHIIEDKSTDKTLDIILSTIKSFPDGFCYEESDTLLGGFKFRLAKCKSNGLEYWIWSNKDIDSIGKGRGINALVLEGYIKEPYFLVVDADTLVDPTLARKKLEEMIKDSNLAAVYGYLFVIPEENTLIGKLYNEGFDISCRIGFSVFRSGSNVLDFHYALSGARLMFSTEIYKKCPRPIDTKAGDTAHAWELQARGYRIKCILDCYGISKMPSRLKGILKQRINWHSGPFQNMYLRGINTLKNLIKSNKRKFFGGLFTLGYYVFFSPIYYIKWGIALPLLTSLGMISPNLTIRYYMLDYIVSLSFTVYSTIILRKYGYYKNEKFSDMFKKFNIFYFFYRPLIAYITTYCGIKFIRDVIKSKITKKKPDWMGFT